MTDEDATQEVEGEAESEGESDAESAEEPDALGPTGTSLVAKVALEDETLAADLEDYLVELVSDREEAEERAAELEEKLRRTRADFQNYKKRAEKRREEVEERATEGLVERLLDVRDNLSRALDDESGDADALREGVELTLREFDRVLDDEGVSEISPEPGSETDPSRHEVLMRVDSDQPEGAVAEVYRPGYEMAGKVLRAAQVTVSEGGRDGEGDDPDDAGGE